MAATMWCRSKSKFAAYLRQGIANISHRQYLCTQVATLDEHDESFYPPIKPKWPPGQWGDMDHREAWRTVERIEDVAKLPSVQERIDHLTAKEYEVWHFPVVQQLPRLLEYQQDKTKTHLVKNLPDIYDTLDVENELDILKPVILDTIVMEYDNIARGTWIAKRHPIQQTAMRVVGQIVDAILVQLRSNHEHLLKAQFDHNVRVEAFWDKYGLTRNLSQEWKSKDPNFTLPKYRRLQTRFLSHLQIRSEEPLPEFLPQSHPLCTEGEYPTVEYRPSAIGQSRSSIKQTCVPGFHIGDPCEFGQLSVQISNTNRWEKFLQQYGPEHARINRIGLGLSSSFVWLVSQAYYQGFNTLMDITYPLTTQTVVTDGQTFSFLAYQLNTLKLWLSDDANSLRNICWHSDEGKLFEVVENGEVKGFNDDVLRQLIKFFVLKPGGRGIDLKPTLPKDDTYPPLDGTSFIPYKAEEEVVEEGYIYDES